MENSCEVLSNGNITDPGLRIIRHPLYQLSDRLSSPCFDIRVFYVRVSNFIIDDSTPECLTLTHVPVTPNTVLEVNGVRSSIDSGGVSCILRRDRVDKKSEEATFVSTNSIRVTGNMKFEVFDKEDLVISGFIEMSKSHNGHLKWRMKCEFVTNDGTGFLKGKQIMGSDSLLPTIEVYVAGCYSGTPIVLTKMLQLKHQKEQRKGILDSSPDCYASERHGYVASGLDLQVAEYKHYKPASEVDYDNLYWRRTEYIEGEDGELSWFNAGVRVGVGIGLGICLGVGIGVGLLVRTYQTTMRTFKRHFA
ncbi:hypothetical protein CDL12_23724 [Handroanthus impetiginosus]|uniref:Erythronate-4-phosphate dehydrogenase family protein n=1 Tax=Handroanthus impetiginosus TaxID=429701 RepID=A0A2G9GEQ1_9LAMI|nr:hypothetical protein CDL12_23724 [Handroanthus impetiginosus]